MRQDVSFHKEHHDILLGEWTVSGRITLIIAAFCRLDHLSRPMLHHASLARGVQANDDNQVQVETLRLAAQQNVDLATRRLIRVLPPSSWLLCPWGLYAFATYPVQPGLNTMKAAVNICAVAKPTSISSQDLMILNILLEREIDSTFWMEENKTLEIPGYNLLTTAAATGTWFGFGQKPRPEQELASYTKFEGYFCGREVKEEHVEEGLASIQPVTED